MADIWHERASVAHDHFREFEKLLKQHKYACKKCEKAVQTHVKGTRSSLNKEWPEPKAVPKLKKHLKELDELREYKKQ